MVSPPQPDPGEGSGADGPRTLRLRMVPWDVICTVALVALVVGVGTTIDWWPRLFGFLDNVCADEDCPPAPFGLNYYIYPVVWGGLGAAVAAVVIGPVVSLVKGWYMSFWVVIALAMVLLTALAGSILSGLG